MNEEELTVTHTGEESELIANGTTDIEVDGMMYESVEPESQKPDELIDSFSDKIMKDYEFQSRFKGAEWFHSAMNHDITCMGLGGIGSWASMIISRFNPRVINLVDMDIVDASNISGQFYNTSQIQTPKVMASKVNINMYSGMNNIVLYNMTAEEAIQSIRSDIFILGFDSIRTRKEIFSYIRLYNPNAWVIDGRLSMRNLQVFCFRANSRDGSDYMTGFLFDEKDADETVCSMKQTSFMSNMIGSVISNIYMSICLKEVSKFPYAVPFLVEYDCLTYKMNTYTNGKDAKLRILER